MKISLIKQLFAVLILSLLLACTSEKQKDVVSGIFLENQLNDFIDQNPDWTKNEQLEKETTEKFKHKLINLSNDSSFLAGMPFELKEVKDTAINEIPTKIAKFQTFSDNTRPKSSLLNVMQLQVIAIVNSKQATELQPNKRYLISGNLHTQGKRKDVNVVRVSDFIGYQLGKYTFQLTDFKAL